MFRGSFWEEFLQRHITSSKDNGVAVREATAAAWKIEIFEYRRVKRHYQGLCCVRTNTHSISLSLTRTRTNTHAAQSSTQPDNDARMFKRHELGVREDHGWNCQELWLLLLWASPCLFPSCTPHTKHIIRLTTPVALGRFKNFRWGLEHGTGLLREWIRGYWYWHRWHWCPWDALPGFPPAST